MQFLIEINFRSGAPKEDARAAAKMLRERLDKPQAGVTVKSAVADLSSIRKPQRGQARGLLSFH